MDLNRSITVGGLGCEQFDEILKNTMKIDQRVSREFDEREWTPWTPANDTTAVVLSNRALTPFHLCDEEDGVDVPDDMGPSMKKLVEGGKFKYVEENVVKYIKRVKKDDGSR